jgi:hypothetical protein
MSANDDKKMKERIDEELKETVQQDFVSPLFY